MIRHTLKSLGLSSLFLAGLLSMLSMTACVASSEESACWLESGETSESGAGEGACDDEEAESADEEAPSVERAASRKAPVSTPQAMCSPICDRI